MTLDKIDPRYDYNPEVAPADGLRSTVYDKDHGILFLTSVAKIEAVGTGDYLVTMRAKSIGDLDAEPEDPPVEQPPVEQPPVEEPPVEEPGPAPAPVPVPNPAPVPVPAPTPIPGRLTSVQEIIDSLKTNRGRDAIIAPGDYPDLRLAGLGGGAMTRIIADPDTVTFRTVDLRGTSNITFEDVNACPNTDSRPLMVKSMHPASVSGDAASTDIHWLRGKVMSRRDGLDYLNFTKDQIQSAEWFGINLAGDDCRVEGAHVFAVWKAIKVDGDRSIVRGNFLEGLTTDAVNWIGQDVVVEDNDAWNFLQVSADHKDGGQTWPGPAGVVLRSIYRRNRIVDWQANPMHPFRAAAQGFNGHNGPHDGLIIEDNEAWVALGWGANWSATKNSTFQRNRIFYTDGPVNIRPDISMFPNSGTAVNPAVHPKLSVTGQNNIVIDNVAPSILLNNVSQIGQAGNRKPDYATDMRPVLTAG